MENFNEIDILHYISHESKEYVEKKKGYFEHSESASKMAERISIHSENGKFPEDLFIKRAPNQTQEEFDYIKANYKTITYPIWGKFTSMLNRIWNDNNWSINWNETARNAGAEDYINFEIPRVESVESYFKNIVTYKKEKDPNAVLVIKPYDLPIISDPETGDISFDETELIQPIMQIYDSKDVLMFDDNFCIVLTDESSECEGHKGEKVKGLVYEMYTTTAIYKVMQYGKKSDYTFELVLYYMHDLGYSPAYRLKGIPIQKGEKILYQSSFYPAIDVLDEILKDNSYLTAVKATHAFPHKWEYVDDCEFEKDGHKCTDGFIWNDNAGKNIKCPACNGSGSKKPSVMGVYQVRTPNMFDKSTENISIPPAGFFAPDTTIMDFLRNEINNNEKRALQVLNLASTSDVQGSETALGKMIDREDAFAMLLGISNQLFELFEIAIQTILDMRYGNDAKGYYPVINYPKNFNIRSEAELTAEIAIAKSQNMPEVAFRELMKEYINRRFSDSEIQNKIFNTVQYVDRILMLNSLEVAQKKANGGLANWEDILHTSIYTFIDFQLQDNPEFLDLPLNTQRDILYQMAKDLDAQNNPVTDVRTSVLNAIAIGS